MSNVLPFNLILTIPAVTLITFFTHSFLEIFHPFTFPGSHSPCFPAKFPILLKFSACLFSLLMPLLTQDSVLGLPLLFLDTTLHRLSPFSWLQAHGADDSQIYSSCPAPCSRLFPHLWLPAGHFHWKIFPSLHIQQSLTELIISPTKPVPLPSSLFLPWRPSLTVIPAQNFEVISNVSLAFILAHPQPFPIMPDNHQVLLIPHLHPNFSYLLESFLFLNLALHHLRAKSNSPFPDNLPDYSLPPSHPISYAQLVNFS